MARASDLRKDVIDVRTGRKLGELADVEIDDKTGRITALVVPGAARLWGLLGNEKDVVIAWSQVVRCGPDCILVEMKEGGEDESGRPAGTTVRISGGSSAAGG